MISSLSANRASTAASRAVQWAMRSAEGATPITPIKASSGIVIPDAAQEKPNRGRVMAVGAGRRLEDGTVLSMAVTVGDEVLFGKYAGQVVKVDGEEITVLKEDDIFAIVEQ